MSPRKKGKRRKQQDAATNVPAKRITRDDIESKMRELQGEVGEDIDSARNVGIAAGVTVAIVLVLIAYVMGRRRGKKRQTVFEIRRI
jgi:tetrahydromethanopterin S-methyltransferase subunit G